MSTIDTGIVLVGLAIVVATLVDVVVTVIGVSGGHGLVSRAVSRSIWRGARTLARGRFAHDILRAAGPTILVAITLVWAGLLVGGWVAIFWPDEALRAPEGSGSVGWWDRVDHAAALVFGGSTPLVESRSQPFGLIGRIARFSGLGLSSFGLAYALPVVGAVVRTRRTATSIAALGGSDGEIESTAELDGEGSVAHLFLVNSSGDISDAGQSTNAYPILPFFHSKEPSASLPLQVARLDRYLRCRVPETSSVPESVCVPLAHAVDGLLDIVADHFLPEGREFPQDREQRRRAIIDAWCRYDGWTADEIPGSPPAPEIASRLPTDLPTRHRFAGPGRG